MPLSIARLLALITTIVVLAGCAQNPQTLRLTVEPPEPNASVSGGPPVALEVVDRRDDKTLGILQNREDENATITTSQDLAYVVELAAGETLSQAGFPPQLWSDTATPRLLIEITELRHTVTADVPRRVDTQVTLQARAWRDGERFNGQASTSRSARVVTRPGPERNAADIARAVQDALRQLFDRRLVDFLSGRG